MFTLFGTVHSHAADNTRGWNPVLSVMAERHHGKLSLSFYTYMRKIKRTFQNVRQPLEECKRADGWEKK